MPKNNKTGDTLNIEHRKKNVKVIIGRVEPFVVAEVAHVILAKKMYKDFLIGELVKLGVIKVEIREVKGK